MKGKLLTRLLALKKLMNEQSLNATVLLASYFCALNVYANPVLDANNSTSTGNYTVQQTPTTTVINQASQKAIINWQSFNIAANEATHFLQPAGGIALNRISPTQGASQIYGKLTATGQIILSNPAGIFFGPGSYVNVGGMIATTGLLSNQDFLSGNYRFMQDPNYLNSGAIINKGTIIAAQNGLIALIARGVTNDGMIEANLGHVILASGDAFTMNFAGNELINFAIDAKTSQKPKDAHGNDIMDDGVKNTGSIIANAGTVQVSAKAAAGVLDNVINMQGFVETQSVKEHKGMIILSGDPEAGVVYVAASLSALGYQNLVGGNVTITGHNILLDAPTRINVSGDAGGGTVLIGGNAKGEGSLPHANAVVMLAGAEIKADAWVNGNGGNTVLWSNDYTYAAGLMSARGGVEGGNGGLVETSSKHYLDANNMMVDTRAPKGKTGVWLLDPSDLTIATSGTPDASTTPGSPYIFSNNANAMSYVTVSALTSQLATTNVTVQTINVGPTSGGDIFVSSAINWSAATTLLLSAYRNITISNSITATAGTLQLQAGTGGGSNTISASGAINVANFTLTQGAWSQNTGSLPTFTVSNNFQIASGATFLRISGGTGASNDAYQIRDIYGLQGINTQSMTAYYKLMNSIDATVTANWSGGTDLGGFLPIGSTSPFQGSFNGQSFVISNLYINRPTTDAVGLFGSIGGSSSSASLPAFTNLSLTNVNITGQNYVGSLVGLSNGTGAVNTMSGTISNISVSGTVKSNTGSNVGGLVGASRIQSISNVFSSVNVTASSGTAVGGMIGLDADAATTSKQYSYSYSTGNVTGLSSVGGFIGRRTGQLIHVYSTGAVSGTSNVGGLIGNPAAGSNTNSFWDTTTSGTTNATGFNTGDVAGAKGLSTTQMQSLVNFTGWSTSEGVAGSITSAATTTNIKPNYTWFIFEGDTRPMLLSEFSYSVKNAHQVQLMGSTLGATYSLANNIDMANTQTSKYDVWGTGSAGITEGFVPIALGSNFTGSLDGNYYVLSNLYINRANNAGLFASTVTSFTAQNLGLKDVTITGASYVGALLGNSGGATGSSGLSGTITNVWATGSITTTSGNSYVGGIVGVNRISQIQNVWSGVNITAPSNTNVGGVIGGDPDASNTQVSNVYSTGSITAINGTNVGGIAGRRTGTYSNIFASGYVNGTGATAVGGLIGSSPSGSTTRGYWNTETTGLATTNGGGTGLTTIQAMASATYASGFFGIGGLAIINQQSFPYLTTIYATTPRAISGTSNLGAGQSVSLITNGAVLETVKTGSNGFYYFLKDNSSATSTNGYIADNAIILVAGSSSNTIAAAPSSGGSLSISGGSSTNGLNLVNNTVTLGFTNTSTISNTDFLNVKGSLSSNILYSVSGSDPTVNLTINSGFNFATTSATTYNLNGTLTANSGSITIGGALSLQTLAPIITSSASNIILNTIDAGVSYTAAHLKLRTGNSGTVTFGGLVGNTRQFTDLTVNDTSTGAIQINSSAISTSGTQTYGNNSTNTTTIGVTSTLTGSVLTFYTVAVSANLIVAPTTSAAIAGLVSGAGSLTKNGVGSFTLNYASGNSYTGGTTLNAGSLIFNSSTALGTNTLTVGGAASLSALNSGYTLSNAMTLNAALTLTGTKDFTLSGVISGSGSVTQSGTNTVTYTNNNSYTGDTTVSSGATLKLGTGGRISSSSSLNLNGTFDIFGNNVTVNGLTGATTGKVTNTSINSRTLSVGNNDVSSTFNGVIENGTGTTNLNKIGNGTFILTGTNTYTGSTTVSLGTLQIGIGTTTGSILNTSSMSISAGATLAFNRSDTYSITPSVSGAGTLAHSGSGILSLPNANSLTGFTNINGGGTLQFGDTSSFGSSTLTTSGSGGTLRAASAGLALANSFTLNTGITLGGTNNFSLNGVISGAGGVTVSNSNINGIILGGSNTYTGITTINNGSTLHIGSGGTTGSILNTASISVSGTLDFNHSDTYSVTPSISGSGTVSHSGFGILSFPNANASFSGTTNLNGGGILQFGSNSSFGTSTITTSGSSGTLQSSSAGLGLTNNFSLGASLILGGANSYSLNAGAIGVISGTGGITVTNTSGVTLGGSNIYSGVTTVNSGGILNISLLGNGTSASNIGQTTSNIVLSGGTLKITSGTNSTNRGFTLSNATTSTIDVANGASATFTGATGSTSGALTKANLGTLILNANNQYSGGTTVSGGILEVQHSSALGTAAVTVQSGAALQLNATSGNLTIINALNLSGTGISNGGALINLLGANSLTTGAITLSTSAQIEVTAGSLSSSNTIGGTSLTKTGSGTLTLSGTNTYTGGSTLKGGKLAVTSDANLGSTSSNNLTFDGGTLQITSGGFSTSRTITINSAGGALDAPGLNDGSAPNFMGNINASSGGMLTLTNSTNNNYGIIILSGNNTFTASNAITIQNKVILGIGSNNALGSSLAAGQAGIIVAASGGGLRASGEGRTVVNPITLNGYFVLGRLTNLSSGVLNNTIQLNAASTIIGTNYDDSSYSSSTIGSKITGNYALTIAGGGLINQTYGFDTSTGIVLSNANNDFTGGLNIAGGAVNTAGRVQLGAAAIPVNTNLTVDGYLNLAGFSATVGSFSGAGTVHSSSGSPTFTVGNGDATSIFSGTLTGTLALAKSGLGSFTLVGANTYSGNTTVNAGSLINGAVNALSNASAVNLAASGATLALGTNNATIASLSGVLGSSITIGSGAILSVKQTTAGTYSGTMSGLGGLTLAVGSTNTLTLTGNNTYSGGTSISAGTLEVQTSGTALGASSGGVSVASGAVLRISGTLNSAIANAITLNGTGISNGGALINASGTNSFSNTVSLATASQINVATASQLSLSGVVSGVTSTLTKTGLGTLVLSANNTYGGGTLINAGALQVQTNSTALGLSSGAVTIATNAALRVSGTLNSAIANAITLNGTGVNNDGALINVSGSNSFSNTVTLNTASQIEVSANQLSLTGVVSGNALNKTGAGTLILSSTNNYSTTTISAGTLQIGAGGSTGTLGSDTVTNNAALVFNRNNAMTVGNVINGSGSLTQAGTSSINLTASNGYTGLTTVNSGSTLIVSHLNALGTNTLGTVVNSGGTLNLNGVSGLTEAITLNGTGVGGNGALTATGTNSISGAISVATASSIAANSGATLAINGGISGAGLTLQGVGTITFDTTAIGSLTSLTSNVSTLNLNTNVTTSGSQIYNSAIVVNSANANNDIALTANGATSDITLTNTTWTGSHSLSLIAGRSIALNGAISAASGGLILSAESAATATSNTSITTGASGTINIARFNLIQGGWKQVGTLPSFTVTNNFQLNSGSGATDNVQFIRAAAGTGTSSPYQLVDIYGVQGVGSNTTTLGYKYVLNNQINASATNTWNSGAGFVPLGMNSALGFTGEFNLAGAQAYVISNLVINKPADTNVGLFSTIDANGKVSKLGFASAQITGLNNVGTLAGTNNGIINIAYSLGSVSAANGSNIGGLVGLNTGSITDTYSVSNVTAGNTSSAVGGLVGYNNGGSITTSFSTGKVLTASSTNVGGFLGQATPGTYTNNFWDEDTSQRLTSAGATGENTPQMMDQATFTNYDFTPSTGVWAIVQGQSYPYLQAFNAQPFRSIQGVAPDGAIVNVLANGVLKYSTPATGGTFSITSAFGEIDDSANLMFYLSGSTTLNNLFSIAPVNNGSLINLNLMANNAIQVMPTIANSSVSNTSLATAIGTIDVPEMLFTYSGSNLVLGKGLSNLIVNFTTNANTNYIADGSITTIAGGTSTVNFGATVAINGGSITTAGAQTYTSAVILGADTNLVSNFNGANGAITFNANVNSDSNITPRDLSLTSGAGDITLINVGDADYLKNIDLASTGTITLNGTIINATSLVAGINTTGSTYINNNISTSGTQSYKNAVFFNGIDPITLSSNNSGIEFLSTVNGARNVTIAAGSGTVYFADDVGVITALTSLTSTGSGNVTFDGAVGSSAQRLASLTVMGATTLNGGAVYTSGDQTYLDGIILGSPTLLNSSSGNVTTTTIDGGNNTLTLDVSQTASAITDLMSNISGFIKQGVGSVTISGSNNYAGDTTLTAGSIILNSASNPLINALGTGIFYFNAGTLSVSQTSVLSNSSFIIADDVHVTISGNQDITFSNGGSLGNSNSALSITNTATTAFNGLSGASAIDMNTTGTVRFSGDNSGLTSDITVTNGSLQINDASFANPLGTGTLYLNGGDITANTNVVLNPIVNSVVLGTNASVTIAGTNDVVFSGNATLNTGSMLTNNNTAIVTFNGDLSGAGQLVQQSSGQLILSGNNVGLTHAIVVNGGTLTASTSQSLGGVAVNVNNATLRLNNLSINNALSLNNATLSVNGNATITGQITLTLGSTNTFEALDAGGSLTVSNNIDGASDLILQGNAAAIILNGTVGENTALTSLFADGNLAGVTLSGGLIKTTDYQVYNTAVSLNADMLMQSSTGSISFANSIDGTFNLAINSVGNSTFDGSIGSSSPLQSLEVTAALIQMNAGSITTSGMQMYHSPMMLMNHTLINTTDADVTFQQSVESDATARNLQINTGSGDITFQSTIGTNVSELAFMDLTSSGLTTLSDALYAQTINTDSAGLTTIAASDLTFTGIATFNDVVTLTNSSLNINGATTFNNTLTGLDTDVTISTFGSTTFNDVVELASLTTSNLNGVYINASAITTSGNQTYNNAVNLGAHTVLSASSADVIFNDNILGNGYALTINNQGSSSKITGILSGIGSSLTKLGSGTLTLGTSGNSYTGGTTINNGDVVVQHKNNFGTGVVTVNTPGKITFAGAFLDLGNNFVLNNAVFAVNGTDFGSLSGVLSGSGLTKIGSGELSLKNANNSITGSATVNAGTLTMEGSAVLGYVSDVNVNANATLNFNFSSNDAVLQTIHLNSATMTNSGLGDVTVMTDLTLSGVSHLNATGGELIINGTINGAGTPIFGGTNNIRLKGNIGNITPLDTLTISGNTIVEGMINTVNDLVFNTPLSIMQDVSYTSSSGNIIFNNTIDGNYSLFAASAGNITFGGTIGSTTPLSILNVTAPTITFNTNNIVTNISQSYNGLVALITDTTFTTVTPGMMVFNNGMSGNVNVNINAQGANTTIMMNGPLTLSSVSVIGTGSNNTFNLNSGAPQTWSISGTDSTAISAVGVTGNFTLSNIQNLEGGNSQNTFILNGTLNGSINGGTSGNNSLVANNAIANSWVLNGLNTGTVDGLVGGFSNIQHISGGTTNDTLLIGNGISNVIEITNPNQGYITGLIGSFNNIGNISSLFLNVYNTLSFSTYNAPITINLVTTHTGSVTGVLNSYSNIDHLNANSSQMSANTININKAQSSLMITGGGVGYIDDPIYFSQFGNIYAIGSNNIFGFAPGLNVSYNSSNSATVNGVTMNFSGFDIGNNPTPTPTPNSSASAYAYTSMFYAAGNSNGVSGTTTTSDNNNQAVMDGDISNMGITDPVTVLNNSINDLNMIYDNELLTKTLNTGCGG